MQCCRVWYVHATSCTITAKFHDSLYWPSGHNIEHFCCAVWCFMCGFHEWVSDAPTPHFKYILL
jgi:hypothetical protein